MSSRLARGTALGTACATVTSTLVARARARGAIKSLHGHYAAAGAATEASRQDKHRNSARAGKRLELSMVKCLVGKRSSKVDATFECRIAASSSLNHTSAMADKWDIDSHVLRRSLACVATCVVSGQQLLLRNLTAWLRECKPDVRFASANLMFDETALKGRHYNSNNTKGHQGPAALSICDHGAENGASQKRAKRRALFRVMTGEVMAARMLFQWILGDGQRVAFELVGAPFRVLSTSARNLWAALFGREELKEMWEFKGALFDRVVACGGIAYDLLHTDAASGNDLFCAARASAKPQAVVQDTVLCLNHQTALCQTSLVTCVFCLSMFNDLYAVAAFIGMGAHMARCFLHVPRFVERPHVLRVVTTPVSDFDKCFAGEVVDFMVTHYAGKSVDNYKARWREFFAVWNGGFSQPGVVTHHCSGPGCCQNGEESTRKRFAVVMQSTMLSKTPSRPSLGKWLLLIRCLSFFWVALTCGVWVDLFDAALAGVAEQPRESAEADGDDADPESDMAWAAVAGKRKARARRALGDVGFRVRLLLLAILVEPMCQMHSYFMDVSNSDPCQEAKGWPPIVDLLNPRASLVHAALEYLTMLCVCPTRCPRLVVPMAQRGCTNFAMWKEAFPGDVALLSRGALHLIGAISRRHRSYLETGFQPLTLCDNRLPQARGDNYNDIGNDNENDDGGDNYNGSTTVVVVQRQQGNYNTHSHND